jgi:hypothetical protein
VPFSGAREDIVTRLKSPCQDCYNDVQRPNLVGSR